MAEPDSNLPATIEIDRGNDVAVQPEQAVVPGAVTETQTSVPAPRPSGDFSSPAVVEWSFREMSWWDADKANALRTRWGNDAGNNLRFADAFATQHSDIAAVLTSNGLIDHPAIIEAAAMLGRRFATVPGDSANIRQGEERPMGDPLSRDDFNEQVDKLRERAAVASARGNTQLANELSEEERQLYDRQGGASGIVDGSTRTA